jgi:putative ABC transport system ATP-binding protein
LMNIIGFLDQPTEGKYTLEGTDVSQLNDNKLAEMRNKKIGFVFQSYNLLPRTVAVANVELPMVYGRGGQKRKHALEALEKVGLKERSMHKPSELSGGEQQRVAIARALVNNPSLILADEPTGNLDSNATAEIVSIFCRLNREGITIVLVTHEMDVAMQTKRIVRLLDGRIIEDKLVESATCDEKGKTS